MRVVLVDPRGDTRPYDHALAAALVERGDAVALWTSAFAHGDVPDAPGVRIEERFYRLADRLPRRLRRYGRGLEHPLDLLALLPRLLRRRADVIHLQWLPMHGLDRAFWLGVERLLRIPVVFTAHDAVPLAVSERRLRRAGRNARAFRAVVTHSQFGRETLIGTLGVDPERIWEIPHGVLDTYRDAEPVAPPLPEGAPFVAFIGLLRPYKGLDVMLDAWPEVRRRVPGAVLYVAGRPLGERSSVDRALECERRGEGVVCDLRFLSGAEFAGALQGARCVALPYHRIDLSGVLFSALATGTPVIATGVGGFREVIDAHGGGLLIPPGDAQALADAAVRLLEDDALRAELSAQALAAAAGPFSWATAAAKTDAMYAAVLRRR